MGSMSFGEQAIVIETPINDDCYIDSSFMDDSHMLIESPPITICTDSNSNSNSLSLSSSSSSSSSSSTTNSNSSCDKYPLSLSVVSQHLTSPNGIEHAVLNNNRVMLITPPIYHQHQPSVYNINSNRESDSSFTAINNQSDDNSLSLLSESPSPANNNNNNNNNHNSAYLNISANSTEQNSLNSQSLKQALSDNNNRQQQQQLVGHRHGSHLSSPISLAETSLSPSPSPSMSMPTPSSLAKQSSLMNNINIMKMPFISNNASNYLDMPDIEQLDAIVNGTIGPGNYIHDNIIAGSQSSVGQGVTFDDLINIDSFIYSSTQLSNANDRHHSSSSSTSSFINCDDLNTINNNYAQHDHNHQLYHHHHHHLNQQQQQQLQSHHQQQQLQQSSNNGQVQHMGNNRRSGSFLFDSERDNQHQQQYDTSNDNINNDDNITNEVEINIKAASPISHGRGHDGHTFCGNEINFHLDNADNKESIAIYIANNELGVSNNRYNNVANNSLQLQQNVNDNQNKNVSQFLFDTANSNNSNLNITNDDHNNLSRHRLNNNNNSSTQLNQSAAANSTSRHNNHHQNLSSNNQGHQHNTCTNSHSRDDDDVDDDEDDGTCGPISAYNSNIIRQVARLHHQFQPDPSLVAQSSCTNGNVGTNINITNNSNNNTCNDNVHNINLGTISGNTTNNSSKGCFSKKNNLNISCNSPSSYSPMSMSSSLSPAASSPSSCLISPNSSSIIISAKHHHYRSLASLGKNQHASLSGSHKKYQSSLNSNINNSGTSGGPVAKVRQTRCRHITDFVLTEEEKRLLVKEGYTDFPMSRHDHPLSKSEERILRKIRRKIRNKRSAQCSRQRKKEYVEDLEQKYAAVVCENEKLKKEIVRLTTEPE